VLAAQALGNILDAMLAGYAPRGGLQVANLVQCVGTHHDQYPAKKQTKAVPAISSATRRVQIRASLRRSVLLRLASMTPGAK
jgi:hypothetical protein